MMLLIYLRIRKMKDLIANYKKVTNTVDVDGYKPRYSQSRAKLFPNVFAERNGGNCCRFIAHKLNGVMFYMSVSMWGKYTEEQSFTIIDRLRKGKWTTAQCLGLEAIPGSRKRTKEFNPKITSVST